MPFPCERCGACCRTIQCRYLEGEDFCSIYENRPDVCRVDKMIDIIGMSDKREQLYRLTKKICVNLRKMEEM
ncbi:MAG: YkgJ family cysteine cluster protein [Pseudomonadota bacterium]